MTSRSRLSLTVSMSSCRRVASHRDFVDMDEAEITDCMADQDVIQARKITKNVDGTRRAQHLSF